MRQPSISWRTVIDALASTAMVVAAVVIVWSQVWRDQAPKAQTNATVGPRVGDSLQDLSRLAFSARAQTLVIAVRSSCQYCSDSIPFYRTLLSRRPGVEVVVVGYESEAVLRAYLAEHRFVPDSVYSITSQELRLDGTPTVLLVDSAGIVVSTWAGVLSRQDEADVMARVQ